jgi:ubiquinol-cytochrome c reductase cytochrome b subunit
MRAKLSHFWFEDRIEPVTPEKLAAAHAHGAHDALTGQAEQPAIAASDAGSALQDTDTTGGAATRG